MPLTEEQKRRIEQNRIKALEKRRKLLQRRQVFKAIENKGRQEIPKSQARNMNMIKGDLVKLALKGDFDVIVHGCNCFCTMGAGIAVAIKKTFPEAYKADLDTTKGSREKLGSYSSATVKREGHQITVVNAYTQFHYSGKGNKVDYSAMKVR